MMTKQEQAAPGEWLSGAKAGNKVEAAANGVEDVVKLNRIPGHVPVIGRCSFRSLGPSAAIHIGPRLISGITP